MPDKASKQAEGSEAGAKKKKVRTGDIDVRDVMPCAALFCGVCSFFFEFPDCCGIVCRATLLCCHCKALGCKAAKEQDTFCKFFNVDIDLIHFRTCCEVTAQAFCIDTRLSIPPTHDIPCMLTCCLFTCCYQNSCLCKFATDVREIEEATGKALPGSYELDTGEK